MLINYADVIMITQPKFTSTILILQTLFDVRKALHRRARSVLPNSLDDMYCVIIQEMWKHTSSPSVGAFLCYSNFERIVRLKNLFFYVYSESYLTFNSTEYL